MTSTSLMITTINLLKPFFVKTGDKIAEKIGEDLWVFIKRKLSTNNEHKLFKQEPSFSDFESELKHTLVSKIDADHNFKEELELKIIYFQKSLLKSEDICNYGRVTNQVIIQINSGEINFSYGSSTDQ